MLTSGPLYQQSSFTIMNVVTLLHQSHHWGDTTKNCDKQHQLNYTSSSWTSEHAQFYTVMTLHTAKK